MTDEKNELELATNSETSKGNGKDESNAMVEVADAENNSQISTEQQPGYVEAAAEQQTQGLSDLEQELIQLRKEKEEIYDRLLRKHADFENYRKRAERDKREYQLYALGEFLGELIVILDNFERALAHSEEQSGPEYRKGIELIYRQLRDLVEKKGLRQIEAVGQKFDPNYHEAISREERDDVPEGTILEEFQKGYFFRDRLLRPSMVKVSYAPTRVEEKTDEQRN